MISEIQAKFTITGKGFSPGEITSLLGIKPTETWMLGDQIPKTTLKMKHNGWCLESKKESGDNLDLAKHVKPLLSQIKPHVTKIKNICSKYDLDIEVACIVYMAGNNSPALYFEKDTIRLLADIGAEIDVDLYGLPECSKDKC